MCGTNFPNDLMPYELCIVMRISSYALMFSLNYQLIETSTSFTLLEFVLGSIFAVEFKLRLIASNTVSVLYKKILEHFDFY